MIEVIVIKEIWKIKIKGGLRNYICIKKIIEI